ncbi:MAG: pantetheine-phosphate adenylyltransferase [Candidatus Cryosericum sp.]|nr:pantetheine-phosphate adenylyltransferase [Candidatus Cryosericum sp.]HPS69310.1 pantetheine-phosphate adenylyltransferase [Candidatus Cryosericum sp.]
MDTIVYPGTFDPVTNGHVDVIERGARLCDQLVVGVAAISYKAPIWSLSERVAMVRDATRHLANVEVEGFDDLLVHFMQRHGARFMLRGLRPVSDFDYEVQFAWANRHLDPTVDIVYLMSSQDHFFVSSTLIKQIYEGGGNIRDLVPPAVADRIVAGLSRARGGQHD